MTAPRDSAMRLVDILEAADKLSLIVSRGKASFDDDWMISDLVVRQLEVIGEAASALPVEFKALHPEIEWRGAIGLRNKLIHGYAGIDYELVWTTAITDIPSLRERIATILTDLEDPTV